MTREAWHRHMDLAEKAGKRVAAMTDEEVRALFEKANVHVDLSRDGRGRPRPLTIGDIRKVVAAFVLTEMEMEEKTNG